MENNTPNIEIKTDLTNTVEQAYNDTLSKPLKSSSGAISTVIDFFHNTVLFPMQKYNLYAQNKLQSYATELQNRAETIPSEYLTEPKVNILGPTIEGLKYNLDEDYIKEMFTNILVSDMDKRKQSNVLPSYVEIVKQLSKNDVDLLLLLRNGGLPSIEITFNENNSISKKHFHKYILSNYSKIGEEIQGNIIRLNPLVIDNLTYLNLIVSSYDAYYPDQIDIYSYLFNKTNKQYISDCPIGYTVGYTKGFLKLTDFGKNFIDICLS